MPGDLPPVLDIPLTITEIYRTILGISDGLLAHSEPTNCPMAAPSGLARLATAVALVRPSSENHRSLYRVGAHKQKGCAKPMRIWPNIVRPKMPPFALVPAYRSQFPTRRRDAVTMMAGFGPPLFKTQMTNLSQQCKRGVVGCEGTFRESICILTGLRRRRRRGSRCLAN